MSGWTELRELGVVFRPFDGPPPPQGGRWSPFSASWTSTVELLAAELRHLDARQVVVEVGLRDRDLRIDGMPRADARMTSDAVRLSFESKWGPLRYETGEYTGRWNDPGWQANLRAIALAMQALRKVDRYGVSKRGEQYRGWRQLAAGATALEDAISGPDAARRALAEVLGVPNLAGMDEVDVVRRALRLTHPDRGGNADHFRMVMRAKEVLGV